MRKLMILVTFFSIILGCKSQTNNIKSVTVVELKEQIDNNKNIQVLDVRTPQEWASGTIKNAFKINVFDKDFASKSEKMLDKNKTIYVYCRSGRRSLNATEILLKKGYKAFNVKGGYRAWKAQVQPVE